MRLIFQHNLYGNIFKDKIHIRESIERQCALFVSNANRGSKYVQLLEFVCK
jgi:hypothetical protein